MARVVSLLSAVTLALAAGLAPGAARARPASRKGAPARPPAARKATAAPLPPAGPVLKSLEVLPNEVRLQGSRSQQLLAVLGTYSDGSVRDLSLEVKYVPVRAGVAAVSADGLVKPAGDGATEIRVVAGRVAAKIPVTVVENGAPAPVRFSRDVVPLLTQAGCNGLACHGSPAGRGGFKLSMYGYDPAADHKAIASQERAAPEKGKRIDPAAPEKSLFLAKPTMQLPHGGALRFKTGSAEHETLLAWLKAGASLDLSEPPVAVKELEVLPRERVLTRTGERQRVIVMARYSDGTAEDITGKSVFSSTDDGVARVDERGVEATGAGEAALMVRYLGRVGVSRVLVPQAVAVPAREYAAFQPLNSIDGLALAKWKKLRLAPAEVCTDGEFLRRASLDLTGTLPSPEEIRAFLAECEAERKDGATERQRDRETERQRAGERGKPSRSSVSPSLLPSVSPSQENAPAFKTRARLVEKLLERPEYADWWSVFWGDALRNNSRTIQPNGAKAYRDWIRQSLAENKPYDQFVRELITATGDSFKNGAVNFYRVARQPSERGEQVAQLFLGVRLQCAQCHNHPFERYTQNEYHQFAAFFARLGSKGLPANEQQFTPQPKGDYKHPENGKVLLPTLLSGDPADCPEEKDRREVLAEWVVSPANALFARNLVNRLWAQLFGRGLVDPVDDIRSTNPASNEALLDALAKDFIARKYDVKHVLRALANSRTYQLSVRPTPYNAKDRVNFSRAYYRRLKAEALLDAVCAATGVPESFGNGVPPGTRAIQLVDNRAQSYFMDVFGRPRREVVCTCEREETSNLTQALHMINGETINRKIASDKGRVAELLKAGKSDSEIVEELYLRTLSRPPTPEEAARAAKAVEAAGKEKRQALDDLLWVLLNSREFVFNH